MKSIIEGVKNESVLIRIVNKEIIKSVRDNK